MARSLLHSRDMAVSRRSSGAKPSCQGYGGHQNNSCSMNLVFRMNVIVDTHIRASWINVEIFVLEVVQGRQYLLH